MALPYGGEWRGNFTLLHMYEQLAYDNFEDRFNLRGPVEPWQRQVARENTPEQLQALLGNKNLRW